MKNSLGVMQGRLLPKYKGRYQAHPVKYWQDEFNVAASLNLDCIEFILDFNDINENPLIKSGGLEEIMLVSKKSGVVVKTICADYFMEAPLHSKDSMISSESQRVMLMLLKSAKILGIKDIVLPCVDQSSLKNPKAVGRFVNSLEALLMVAEDYNINFSLETDLNPQSFVNLLDQFNSNNIKVNYDIGNSASLGYNPLEELSAYGDKISDIHIKDRGLNGGPKILGNGDADFDVFFKKLKEFDYIGPFIMQAYRDDEGINVFVEQLDWIKKYFSKYNYI